MAEGLSLKAPLLGPDVHIYSLIMDSFELDISSQIKPRKTAGLLFSTDKHTTKEHHPG